MSRNFAGLRDLCLTGAKTHLRSNFPISAKSCSLDPDLDSVPTYTQKVADGSPDERITSSAKTDSALRKRVAALEAQRLAILVDRPLGGFSYHDVDWDWFRPPSRWASSVPLVAALVLPAYLWIAGKPLHLALILAELCFLWIFHCASKLDPHIRQWNIAYSRYVSLLKIRQRYIVRPLGDGFEHDTECEWNGPGDDLKLASEYQALVEIEIAKSSSELRGIKEKIPGASRPAIWIRYLFGVRLPFL